MNENEEIIDESNKIFIIKIDNYYFRLLNKFSDGERPIVNIHSSKDISSLNKVIDDDKDDKDIDDDKDEDGKDEDGVYDDFDLYKNYDDNAKQKFINNKIEVYKKNLLSRKIDITPGKIDNTIVKLEEQFNKYKQADEKAKNEYEDNEYSDKINKFSVYMSNSELGCYRLCLKDFFGNYIKGEIIDSNRDTLYDYVQQTFIHLELQKFIYKYYDNLDNIGEKLYCFDPKTIIDNKLKSKQYFIIDHHINNKYRVGKYDPFFEYNEQNKCGDDKDKRLDKITEDLNIFSKKLESIYKVKENSKKFIFSSIINDEGKIDEMAKNNYKINFYQLELNLKEKNDKHADNIVLYYCNAYITKFHYTQYEKIFVNLPIFITTKKNNGANITKFGTFKNYILSGNYICKIFDYNSQCSYDLKKKQKVCYANYVLIGDRYDQIFPLNIINQELHKQLSVEDKEKKEEETQQVKEETQQVKKQKVKEEIQQVQEEIQQVQEEIQQVQEEIQLSVKEQKVKEEIQQVHIELKQKRLELEQKIEELNIQINLLKNLLRIANV